MERQELTEDLKFIRSMIERTQLRIDARAPITLTWGVIALVGFPMASWLADHGRAEQIDSLWFVLLWLIGAPLSAYFGWRAKKKSATLGGNSYVSRQIGWVWLVLVPNGILWSGLVRFGLGMPQLMVFVWAAVYGIGLAVMGILYSREWLIAGVAVFASVPIAAFSLPQSGLILGVAMGLGCIFPAVIALLRERRGKVADAHA